MLMFNGNLDLRVKLNTSKSLGVVLRVFRLYPDSVWGDKLINRTFPFHLWYCNLLCSPAYICLSLSNRFRNVTWRTIIYNLKLEYYYHLRMSTMEMLKRQMLDKKVSRLKTGKLVASWWTRQTRLCRVVGWSTQLAPFCLTSGPDMYGHPYP